jgi:hypothetical protein
VCDWCQQFWTYLWSQWKWEDNSFAGKFLSQQS